MIEQDFMLVLMVFIPAAAAIGVMLAPAAWARGVAMCGALVALAVSLRYVSPMLEASASNTAAPAALTDFLAYYSRDWLAEWGIRFTLGLDAFSGLLVLLTNVLMIVSILASWTAIRERTKEFYVFLLVLQTGILGTFLSLDLFVFYIFWEVMLFPLYFLIGIFGSGRRIYATLKFVLYTMVGSLLMLVGIIALHFEAAALEPGLRSFGLFDLLRVSSQIPYTTQVFLFFSFFLAFAIKVPLFPFHTWLPDAHTEAPTAGSIMLAGVLLKTGVYGLMRFAIPLFPAVADEYAWLVLLLSAIAVVYGALTAIVQRDMKRLVAYSSVSHMGFIMLGLFAFGTEAVAGAALQMVNHGISTGALFFCVGVLYERRHTRLLAEFGGLAQSMKIYSVLTVIVVLSSVGLPGLNGFVGEFLILLGTFQVSPWLTAVAATGVILAAVYLLRMTQLSLFGPLTSEANARMRDVNPREAFSLILLCFFAFWIGLFPTPWLRLVEPISRSLTTQVAGERQASTEMVAEQRLAEEEHEATSEGRMPPQVSDDSGVHFL